MYKISRAICPSFSRYFTVIFPTFNQRLKRTNTSDVLPQIPSHSSTVRLNIKTYTLERESKKEKSFSLGLRSSEHAVLVVSISAQHSSSTDESWNRKEVTREKEREQKCLGK